MVTSKNQAIVDRLLKKNNKEPIIDLLNYNNTLMLALNYYNREFSDKDKRKWFQEHFKRGLTFPITQISDYEFRTAGTLCRILANGNQLIDEHEKFIGLEVERLRALSIKKAGVAVTGAPIVTTISSQDKVDRKISDFLAEFNAMVDEYIINRDIGNVDKLVNQFGVTSAMSKKILLVIEKPLAELEEAYKGKDKQLVEGYSNFKKTELKKLIEIYRTLVAKLDQAKKVVIRKPRAKKEKPAAQLVAKLKFCKENAVFNLKSAMPVSIIGATEVWTFNVKYKKLQVYKAVSGMTLTVKGSSLLNFSVDDSMQKTIRKPDQIAELTDKGKRSFAAFMKAVKSKPAAVNGRFNDDTLILATFK